MQFAKIQEWLLISDEEFSKCLRVKFVKFNFCLIPVCVISASISTSSQENLSENTIIQICHTKKYRSSRRLDQDILCSLSFYLSQLCAHSSILLKVTRLPVLCCFSIRILRCYSMVSSTTCITQNNRI